MDYTKATNHQLKVILSEDGELPPCLLLGAVEEAIRREIYRYLIINNITKFFKSTFVAEKMTDTSLDDLIQICYIEMYNNIKYYKQGSYIYFWVRCIKTKLIALVETAKAEKRKINELKSSIYDKENKKEVIQIVSDRNVERKVVNSLYLDYLFQFVSKKQLEVLQLMKKGYRTIDVAEKLGLERKTVDKRFRDAQLKILKGIGI
jgi:DNA-directed RNA polymerase specialized sigma24 family protein